MGREKEIEKKFTAYLDRILAGEEIQADPAMDAELRAALDFARKISALGAVPSAQFQARLKASLLQKLEEQEAQKKAKKASFWDVFRSHPAWQGAAAVLLVIIALTIVWRAGVFQPSLLEMSKATTTQGATTTAPATAAAPTTKAPMATTSAGYYTDIAMPVSIIVKTDKLTYKSDEDVKIELTIRNTTAGQLTITDFPPILSLMKEDTKQPVYTFAAGKAAYTLEPNGAARYTYTWKQTDFNGQPVSGKYYVELEDLEYNGVPTQLKLMQPVKFEILSSPVY
jgi:hypothetical protein